MSDQPAFVSGDIVRLKSGGPAMVVASAHKNLSTGHGYVFTTWFSADGGLQNCEFRNEQIAHTKMTGAE